MTWATPEAYIEALRDRGFTAGPDWTAEFQGRFTQEMVCQGISPPSARAYAGAVAPAVRVILVDWDPTSGWTNDSPQLWALALTPPARKLFSAGWGHFMAWALRHGVVFPPFHPEGVLPHTPAVRSAVVGLLGAGDAPPLPRHLSRALWSDVLWDTGAIRLDGRKGEYGIPSDPGGLRLLLGWMFQPTDPRPMRLAFGLKDTALREQAALVQRLLGPRWSLPLVPVHPGSRIPVSQGVLHEWRRG